MQLSRTLLFASFAIALGAVPLSANEADLPCSEDAMIIFDGSGSMAGTDMNSVSPRIGKVREALSRVLPDVAPLRRIGLIIYGPGPYNVCETVELKLRPEANAADKIMAEVNAVAPAGRTPLTTGVRLAAETLEYRTRPATIVLITDGEETCGGDPCALAAELKSNGAQTTVHIIGYKDELAIKGPFGSRCLAEQTGGKYISVRTTEDLVKALRETLGCPQLTYNEKTLPNELNKATTHRHAQYGSRSNLREHINASLGTLPDNGRRCDDLARFCSSSAGPACR